MRPTRADVERALGESPDSGAVVAYFGRDGGAEVLATRPPLPGAGAYLHAFSDRPRERPRRRLPRRGARR